MNKKDEVKFFLRAFKEKYKLTTVFFRDDSGKNAQALAELEVRPTEREEILLKLDVEDYVEGPIEDNSYGKNSIWVFGREVKEREVVIKISMGKESKVNHISFHLAERPIFYPLKTKRHEKSNNR